MRPIYLKGFKILLIGCLATFFLCSSVLVTPLSKALALSSKELTAKLIEGAKKEGKLTWYTSTAVDDSSAMIKGFKKKYPFVKVSLYRTSATKLLAKVITEANMGSYFFDVITNTGTRAIILQNMDLIAPYYSPERKFYPKEFKDEDGYRTAYTINTHIIAYNTKMISPAEAPRNYEDLLDPKWKGKLGIDHSDFSWFATQLEIMGKEKGLDYFRRLAKQKLNLRKGHTLLVQLCIAGEFPIVVNAYAQRVEKEKQKGAPIEWVPVNPVVFHSQGIMLGKHASHPNSGKLFIDFILSFDGQKIIRDRKRIPTRSDVPPDPPRLVKGLTFKPRPNKYIADNYAELEKQFYDIVKRR